VHGDRALLQLFECTEKAHHDRATHRTLHPKPWELEAQSAIKDLRPPVSGAEMILIAEDHAGIGAVVWTYEFGSPTDVKIMCAAIVRRLRGKRGIYADELMSVTFERLVERLRASGQRRGLAIGLVHKDNLPSQRMCRQSGGYHYADDDEYQKWQWDLEA